MHSHHKLGCDQSTITLTYPYVGMCSGVHLSIVKTLLNRIMTISNALYSSLNPPCLVSSLEHIKTVF